MTIQPLSQRSILLFWSPLALQWLMIGLEGPFLAAVIARLGEPTFNLAAYGVAYAFAILVESPVIMLMSASTALVVDAGSYRRLRVFANLLSAASTALLLLILVPPLFRGLMIGVLGLPGEVSRLVYGALWLLLPWPAAIGDRRFLHGLLIRAGRTRWVAYGTVLRLAAMAGTAGALSLSELPGALVGAAALSAGVVVEALAARIMARRVVRQLLATPGEPDNEAARGYGEIARFYYPLALTSLIGLTVQPLLTFFMGRAPAPVQSLALFPVVNGLSFLFRTLGMSFQEAAIALIGPAAEHAAALRRFALGLALVSSGAMALVAGTPLASVWFRTLSGLPSPLAELALTPARIAVVLPALSVALSWQRARLVQRRTTRPISLATAIEVVGIAALFPLFGPVAGLMGVTAAMLAFVGGRAAGVLFLVHRARR